MFEILQSKTIPIDFRLHKLNSLCMICIFFVVMYLEQGGYFAIILT